MSFALQVVIYTPLWVWPLLLLVLWQGWRGLNPARMSPSRLAVLPLVGLISSLVGLAQAVQPGLALAASAWVGLPIWCSGRAACLPRLPLKGI